MQIKYQSITFATILFILFSFGPKSKWKPLGPFRTILPNDSFKGWSAHGNGRIFDLVVHPKNAKKIWVCSSNGGIFFTKNRGKKWVALNMPVAGGATFLKARFSKKATQLFMASNISMPNRKSYSFGIFKSSDNGKSWDTIKLLNPSEYNLSTIGGLAVSKDKLLYCINKTLYSYENDRETKIYELNFKPYSIKINPKDDSEWYVCGERIIHFRENGKIAKTVNYKDKRSFNSVRADLCFAEREIKLVYHTKKGNYLANIENDIIVSSKRTNTSIDPNRTSIVYDSFRKQYLIGGVRLHELNINGKITQITRPNYPHKQHVHDDIRAIKFDHLGNILLAHDAGISISENGGKKWFNINGCGLNIMEVYDLAIDKNSLVIGAQDLSSFIYHKKNKSWEHTTRLYGDGGTSLIANNIIMVMQGTYLMQKTKTSFTGVPIPKRASSFNPPIIARSDTLYYANKHLWRRIGAGKWLDLTPKIDNNYRIVDLEVEGNRILFAKVDPVWSNTELRGKLFLSDDNGVNWQDITKNIPALAYKSASSLFMNKNNFYLTTASFDNPKGTKEKVFKSTNNGKSWRNISLNLPNVPFNDIIEHEGSLIAASDIGAYILDQNKWIAISKLPACPMMKFKKWKNRVYAVTYGRGLWYFDT